MGTNNFTKWLKGKMASENKKQHDVARWLCVSQPAFSEKLKNGRFTLQEVITIFRKFKATNEEIVRCLSWE